MSHWERHNMQARLLAILQEAQPRRSRRFNGRPFVDAYDLAVTFAERHEAAFRDIRMPLGGKGTRVRRSLAWYIARNLSGLIARGLLPHVEMVDMTHLSVQVTYAHLRGELEPQPIYAMFRLRG